MKTWFLTVLSVFIFLPLNAQIKPKQHDWFFYDISYDYLLHSPEGLEQYWRSNGHSISVLNAYRFGKTNMSLGYGLGFMSNNFFNNLGVSTSLNTGDENFNLLNPDSIKHNKFTVQHLFVPLEIRLRSNLNESGKFFRFYIGGRLGLRIKSYSQLDTENATIQYRHLGSMKKFNYGVYTRIGYDHFSIYAYYGLSEVFTEGNLNYGEAGSPQNYKVSKMRPLSVGISLSL